MAKSTNGITILIRGLPDVGKNTVAFYARMLACKYTGVRDAEVFWRFVSAPSAAAALLVRVVSARLPA